MECEEVRNRFSALLEEELSSPEEREMRDHLASCPGCDREWRQFVKTMDWLHSAEDEEVPQDFQAGIYRKMEERKGAVQETGTRGFLMPPSFRLPIQAVAMVAIVFLVLYLSKMTPRDLYQARKVEPDKVAQVEIRGPEKTKEVTGPKAEDQLKTPPVTMKEERKKPVKEEKREAETPKAPRAAPAPTRAAEQPSLAAPAQEPKRLASEPAQGAVTAKPGPPGSDMGVAEAPAVKDAEEAKPSSVGAGKTEGPLAMRAKAPGLSKPPQEMVLKSADRRETVSQVEGLLGRLGGTIFREDEESLWVSLPASSVSALEKELVALGSAPTAGERMAKTRAAREVAAAPESKKREERETTAQEVWVTVRIVLVKE